MTEAQRLSRAFTLTVPQLPAPVFDAGIVAQSTPGLVIDGGAGPTRALVRNISFGIDVNLAYEVAALLELPLDSGTFVLPAGFDAVFMVMPGQKLFVASSTVGGRVSITVSPWYSDYNEERA
jgi:hypothetical protein